ncbi:3-ketoacyl-(acyl-carrier-protein) reductase [compost metagenome]|uniref:Uncharacterized protein n=1 Tax=Pseudomonas fluorescens TaxID=294 RepID=A0A5E7UDE3_PSEFL|nr:hypothetical protein PS938_02962 [Pseudomonas fluorescens]
MAVARAIQSRCGAIVQTGWSQVQQAIRAKPSADYSVVNAGVHGKPRNQALELASPSICINSVTPAMVVQGTILESNRSGTLLTFNLFHQLRRNGQPAE